MCKIVYIKTRVIRTQDTRVTRTQKIRVTRWFV
jgi:hypothetical protein